MLQKQSGSTRHLPWNIEGISKKAYDARMKKKKEEDKAAKGRQKAEDKAAREAIKEAESAAREAEKATKALQKSQAPPLKNKKKILILGGSEGATTRELLRYDHHLGIIRMVDYDSELVELMCLRGNAWSQGSFQCPCLSIIYDDAWSFIKEEDD